MDDVTKSVRVRATRPIAAGPTSIALLLAGPAALDLWPGVHRVGQSSGGVLAEALIAATETPDGVTRLVVRARPPRRSLTSYVLELSFTSDRLGAAAGRLVLDYLNVEDASARTLAHLDLDYTAAPDGAAVLPAPTATALLRRMADRFLTNLAEAAQERSSAA